jgi:hypothetical protein
MAPRRLGLRWRRPLRLAFRLVTRPLRPLVGITFAIVVFVTATFGNYFMTIFLPMITGFRHFSSIFSISVIPSLIFLTFLAK